MDDTSTRSRRKPTPTLSIVGNGNYQAGRDLYINKRETIRTEVTPGPEHISEEVAFKLSELVKEAVDRESKTGKDKGKLFAAWWNKLKKRYKVTSYKLIPRDQGDDAVAWMSQQVARLLPKLRRTDNSNWRKAQYAKINASLNTLGWDKEKFYALVLLKLDKKIKSTTELGERDLESIAGIISRMSKKQLA